MSISFVVQKPMRREKAVSSRAMIRKEEPSISVIMPAYNEREHIADSVGNIVMQLDGLGYRYEILVVDDGSTDGTFELVNELNMMNVKVIRFSRNQGKGFALMYGLNHVKGDFIFFIDSDMEIKTDNIERYISALESYDLVIASKMLPQSRYEAPLMRRFLSVAFQTLVKLLVGVKATDTQTGLKAGRAESLKRIFALLSVKRYAFDVELLTVAELLNFRFVEMPVNLKMSVWFKPIEALMMFKDLLGIAYRLKVRKWYQSQVF